MKSPHLFIALLFASILAFQVQSLKLRDQATLKSDDQQFAKRLDFKELLKTAFHETGSVQTLANVYRYYIDGATYFNYIQRLFCQANTNDGEFITLQQYLAVTTEQGIHEVDARRIAQYIRGIFGAIRYEDEEVPIDAFRFTQAVDILFAESVSLITFTHITRNPRPTRYITVDLDQVKEGLVEIFKLLQDTYPLPDCNELAYLFTQSDVDHDGRLNLQEFHVFLSIYLKFYKSGILSNRYAAIIMKDEVYNFVFSNQDSLGSRLDRTKFLTIAFRRFLQMSMSDRMTNQLAHIFFTKFDSNGSGAIDPEEFRALLGFFHAPLNEVNVLFLSADTNGNGVIDFSEFVVVITTLLRRLTADFGEHLIKGLDGTTNVEDSYRIFRQVERDEQINIIEADKFRDIFRSVNVGDHYALNSERFAVLVSEVVAYAKTKIRISEEGQITAIAGLDVDDTSLEQIFAIKEEASEQVNDIIYAIGTGLGIEPTQENEDVVPEDISYVVDQVQEETGVTYSELEKAVEDQIHGATVEEVIDTIAAITTEEVLNAIATAALEEVAEEDCPTQEAIAVAIEHAIEDGVAEDLQEEAEHLTGEEIIETVTEVVEAQQIAEEVTQTLDLHGDVDTKDILETIEAETGADLSTEEFVEVIEEATGATSYTEVLEIIENSTPEDLIETATEVIQEETIQEPEELEWKYEEAVIDKVEHDAEVPIEDLQEVVEEQTGGATIEEVIEAATSIATEEFVDVVTEAVLEEAESTDCPTVQTVEEVIEQVIEDGAADDIIETIEETPSQELVEAVTEALEEAEEEEQASEESEGEEEPETIIEQIQQESGLTEDDLEDVVESQVEGATVEEYVEAAEDIASTEVVEAITDAVYEEALNNDCVTEEGIEETIQEVIEGGVVEEIIEQIEETPSDEVIEAVTAVIEEEHPQPYEPEQYQEEISHEIEEDTGYTGEEIGVAIKEELGAIDLNEVVEVAQEIAKEEVIGAVTDAAYEEAESNDCVSQEDIHDAIQEVIQDGAVVTAVEQIEENAGEAIETIVETIKEEHEEQQQQQEEQIEQQVEEESGASSEEIQEFLEAETGVESIGEIVEAAQELATEELIEAVTEAATEAAVEEAHSSECVTAATIESLVEDALKGDTFDQIVEQLEQASNQEILEAISETIEEGNQGSEESGDHFESSYLQLSSNKSNLKNKRFLRKLGN